MTLAACADLVRRGDPDRFRAAMAAPAEARTRLFPLYAFNLEVARAPWVASEPMIGQMRLQFWRDVLDEIAQGKPTRAHEVVVPLAQVIGQANLPVALLDDIIVARWADLERQPFADAAALGAYLDATSGNLMEASARALGLADDMLLEPARAIGRASGLAQWLLAVPELERRGWSALPRGVEALVGQARNDLAGARRVRFGAATPALRAAWRAEGILARAEKSQDAILAGRLAGAEVANRWGLLAKSLTGRW